MPYGQKRRRRGEGGKLGGYLWMVAFAALVAAVGGGWLWLKGDVSRHQTDKATGCLTAAATPEAALFLVDATDRLSAANAKLVVHTIESRADQMPRYARILVVPFGDDIAAPLEPIFDRCLPGRGGQARLNESPHDVQKAYDDFAAALETLDGKLQTLHDSKTSPISGQIVRAASTPELNWKGEHRTLELLTDGLETSIYWTNKLKLEPPPAGILQDVTAEFVEIGNAHGVRLQTPQMRLQWKSWLEQAGAKVRMTAPGFSADHVVPADGAAS